MTRSLLYICIATSRVALAKLAEVSKGRRMRYNPIKPKQSGFTLIEILVVVAILGILMAIGIISYANARSPAQEAKNTLNAILFQTRAEAAGTTSAKRLRVSNDYKKVFIDTSKRCNDPEVTWKLGEQTINMPEKMVRKPLTIKPKNPLGPDDNILICFTSRGLVDKNKTIQISDTQSKFFIDLSLAGGVRISGS